MVEENSPHVVQMPIERKQASASLVAPDLDLVIISSGHEKRLRLVEINATDGAIVFLKAVNQHAHAVVP